MFKQLVIVALLGSAPCASLAAMYKWVDDDGNVVYSERKPTDKTATEVKKHGASVSDEEARQRLEALKEKATKQQENRQQQAEYAEKQLEREQRMQKNCEIARENMRILQTAPRVKDVDADGNEYFIEDGARAARIQRARDQMKQYCD